MDETGAFDCVCRVGFDSPDNRVGCVEKAFHLSLYPGGISCRRCYKEPQSLGACQPGSWETLPGVWGGCLAADGRVMVDKGFFGSVLGDAFYCGNSSNVSGDFCTVGIAAKK